MRTLFFFLATLVAFNAYSQTRVLYGDDFRVEADLDENTVLIATPLQTTVYTLDAKSESIFTNPIAPNALTNALVFSQAADSVTIADDTGSLNATAFTVAMLIKFDTLSGTLADSIVQKQSSGSARTFDVSIAPATGAIQASVVNTSSVAVGTAPVMAVDTWYRVVVSFSTAQGIRMWVDKDLVVESSDPSAGATIVDTTSDIVISPGSTEALYTLADFAFYDEVLTPEAVNDMVDHRLMNFEQTPVVWVRFGNGPSDVIATPTLVDYGSADSTITFNSLDDSDFDDGPDA